MTPSAVDPHWPALLARLSGTLDLDASARASGALRRRRAVADGATLLRLALAHGPGDLSLRSAAAWAGMAGVAALSDVALRKRLRSAADWLGQVAGALLCQALVGSSAAKPLTGKRLRVVDASSIISPGAAGTDWRLHTVYEPGDCRFTAFELTDVHGGEGFTRFRFGPDEVALGDRGYAKPRGLQHVLAADADFIVRVGWYSLRMTAPDGVPLDWEAIYAALAPGEVTERQVIVTQHSRGPERRSKPLFPARLIVMRQHDDAGQRALRAAKRGHSKRRSRNKLQPLTLTSTGYLMVLTSLPAEFASAADMLAAYRLRWQVEVAFKRLKSGLEIDRLLARDPAMARSWLLAHLILALLIEDAASEVLDAPPCAPGRPQAPCLAVAPVCPGTRRPARAGAGRHGRQRPCPRRRTAGPAYICDPPRRRPSQAAAARVVTRAGGAQTAAP